MTYRYRAWARYRNHAPQGILADNHLFKAYPLGYSNQDVCKNPDTGINDEGTFFKMQFASSYLLKGMMVYNVMNVEFNKLQVANKIKTYN